MRPDKIIEGKRILIVDDEKDVLHTLNDLLSMCKIDGASSFGEAKRLLEENDYDVAILDIMGVNGFDLLKIAKTRNIPALMLTAHALSEENLKRSAEDGAFYYAPKDEMKKIDVFVADLIEAKEKKNNVWVRWFERLGGYFDNKFSGPNWRKRHKEFWDKKLKEFEGL
jgi:DNA-binding NtrC family response regulator